MNAEIKKTDGTVEVVIEGRVDTTTAPRLEKIIREQMEDCQELILNMEKMDYMSSAGLRVLLVAQKQMQKQGSMVLRLSLIHICGSQRNCGEDPSGGG